MARIESVRDKLTVYDPGAESGAFIERAYHPPSWATGYISRGDARFRRRLGRVHGAAAGDA
jgi:hypothetical protein